jgi:ABC-type sulfate/molybdate transport systems ATPase subunit
VNDSVVQLHDVLVRDNGRSILDIPRFSVDAGETVALVGPNGAGKTTLLHVAAFLKLPDRGSAFILGQPLTTANTASLRRAIAVVFQEPLLFNVSVLDNAAAGARFQGQSRAEAERRARLWLQRFGVHHLAERRARGISGGEAARVALARAFATDPTILLLDEPFSALDAPTRTALLPALRTQLRETGAAAVLVTHDLEEAFAFAERIDLMEGGRIIASDQAATLIARPPSRRAAELLGIETILEARVTGFDVDGVLLAIQPNGPLVKSCHPEGRALCPGEVVTLTIPAGGITLVDPEVRVDRRWNEISGIVSAVTPMPTGRRVVVDVPAPFVAFAAWEPRPRNLAIGERVCIGFAPELVNVIRETPGGILGRHSLTSGA